MSSFAGKGRVGGHMVCVAITLREARISFVSCGELLGALLGVADHLEYHWVHTIQPSLFNVSTKNDLQNTNISIYWCSLLRNIISGYTASNFLSELQVLFNTGPILPNFSYKEKRYLILITVLVSLAGRETLLQRMVRMNGEIQRNTQTALHHSLTKSIHKSDFMWRLQ